jgi:predicted CXXCH cytochrome family protein
MFGGQNMHDLNNDGEIDNYDCVVCHEFSDMNGEIDLDIDFRKASTAYENKTAFCLNCHDGNGAFSVMPPALSFNSDSSNIYSTYKGTGTTTAEQMQTADIHGVKNGSGQSFATFRGAYANNQEISCLSCHQAHTSDNAYLITESGASAKLADDEAKNASVSVEGSNFTELCAVCHMSENGAITNNGLKEVVHTSTYSSNCTDCHYHGAGHGTDQDGLF